MILRWIAGIVLAVVLAAATSIGLKAHYQNVTKVENKETPAEPSKKDKPFTIAVVGDSVCKPTDAVTPGACQMEAVASAVKAANPRAILMPGDLQYDKGELENYLAAFDKYWGPLADRIYPVPGNHEYSTPSAVGYFTYWQGKKRDVGLNGYYSMQLGDWKLFALNSNCEIVECDVKSMQSKWLAEELAKSKGQCVVAMWHHPLFTSGKYADLPEQKRGQVFWEQLDKAGAEIIVNGHDHIYERFAPRSSNGELGKIRGIRQFVVGTGGKSLYQFGRLESGHEAGDDKHFGFLLLTLRRGTYTWEFRDTAQNVLDSGRGWCHW